MATRTAPATLSRQKRIRKIFGNIHEVIDMPNLIEVQRESYEQFLRSDPSIGYVSGLEKTLRSVFPIKDFAGTSSITTSKTPIMALKNAVSAELPMPHR